MTLERNIILQLRKEGYSDKTILAICKNELIGLDTSKVQNALGPNRTRRISANSAYGYLPKIDSSYFLG